MTRRTCADMGVDIELVLRILIHELVAGGLEGGHHDANDISLSLRIHKVSEEAQIRSVSELPPKTSHHGTLMNREKRIHDIAALIQWLHRKVIVGSRHGYDAVFKEVERILLRRNAHSVRLVGRNLGETESVTSTLYSWPTSNGVLLYDKMPQATSTTNFTINDTFRNIVVLISSRGNRPVFRTPKIPASYSLPHSEFVHVFVCIFGVRRAAFAGEPSGSGIGS